MRALIKYQPRIYFCLVFVLDSLMAEEQNTAVVEEAKDDQLEKKDEVEEPPARWKHLFQKWQRPILLS